MYIYIQTGIYILKVVTSLQVTHPECVNIQRIVNTTEFMV